MKLNEITGKEKAEDVSQLINSVKNGVFTRDGSHLKLRDGFYCPRHFLTSLEGCPGEVNGDIELGFNKLTSLKDVHKHIKKMNGRLFVNGNPIKSHVLGVLKIEGCDLLVLDNIDVEAIINEYLPLGDIFDCQEELIEAGFPEYAQL